MLTKKQLDLLAFIHKRVQRDGVPPSFDEMKLALDLRSKSGIHRLITALEERGFIAAGVPIEAINHITHSVAVPGGMVAGSGDHYALEVQGDSMIEAGINDGDVVVIRETSVADDGDIVVALVDDSEATLKRFRRKGSSIALEAANPAYETRVLPSDQVKVQGRLVGLIRTY